MSSGEWVTIIAAAGLALVGIVNAVGSFWGNKTQGEKILAKSDEIHKLVNGNSSLQERKFSDLEGRFETLQKQLTESQEARINEARTSVPLK